MLLIDTDFYFQLGFTYSWIGMVCIKRIGTFQNI